MSRPEPYKPAPPGYRWEAIAQTERWQYVGPGCGYQCRYFISRPVVRGSRSVRCPNDAVARLNRQWAAGSDKPPNWWYYCADHLYGRWIEDEQVLGWRLVRKDAEDG